MDQEIEANPESHPEWEEVVLSDAYTQLMTDDAGGYVIATAPGPLVIRRSGADDQHFARSLADWVWDRVAAFGGRDPRPVRREDESSASTSDPLDPHPDVLAELDRLNDACRAAPGDTDPQVELWTAVTALDHWVIINRGTPEAPRPYSLAGQPGAMLCVYSSATRAKAAAYASGLVPDGDPVPLLAVPLPAALDWVMSFGEHGVVGVTIDHPRLGAWCPLANLPRLRQLREQ
ncbi:hypothetical protein [Nocardioides alcanivorans]|uniref:hypothetical protein n=1 Tax=Nocardioides alcanivorans TaxID=2897352 RepID=UPI001F1FC525|nr:hypothetical protein [Nocardioides alcanivorans]